MGVKKGQQWIVSVGLVDIAAFKTEKEALQRIRLIQRCAFSFLFLREMKNMLETV